MASEYLRKKYQDVKPEIRRELTPAEKRKNWWYYYKWHVVIGAGLLAILGSIVWNALHQIKPDYQIAYVGTYALLGRTASGSSDDLLSGLYIARRGFWTEKTAPYPEGCEALWEKITEGAFS